MASFEQLLDCASLLRERFEIESVGAITETLRAVSMQAPERFREYHDEVCKRLGQPLHTWLVAHQHLMPVYTHYSIAGWMSCAAIVDRDYELAMEYWAPILVSERPPERDDLVGISANEVESYDSTKTHRDAAMNLCRFAISETITTGLRHLDVLDICCGTGLNSDYLAAYARRMVGVDMELDGLIRAGRATRYKSLIKGDAIAETARLEGEFDLLMFGGAAYFFKDLEWLFAAAGRLLRPGGTLVFNSHLCPDSADWMITSSGSFRYCQSDRRLREAAAHHGLVCRRKSWQIIYNHHPTWFWCFSRPTAG